MNSKVMNLPKWILYVCFRTLEICVDEKSKRVEQLYMKLIKKWLLIYINVESVKRNIYYILQIKCR